jgi:hypothetical protein
METARKRANNKYSWVMVFLVGIFLGAAVPLAYCYEPHMEAALRHLQAARVELERAVPNKGGHRERAIDLVDRAIVQVNEGMNYRR